MIRRSCGQGPSKSDAARPPVTAALTGAIAALVSLRLLFALGFRDLAFVLNWTRMLTILGALALSLVALCAAAAWPNVPRDAERPLRNTP